MIRGAILLVAIASAIVGLTPASAQTLDPSFAADYSVVDLGAAPGVPDNLGGLTFLDSDTLLIGGAANGANGAIYSVDVTRDSITGQITGFAGPSTLYAEAPNIDGGLVFGPGGVLFYTGYPTNSLGQIKPGSTAPDKVINLTPLGIGSSVGTIQIVPAGFAGAGQLKVASYSTSTWYTATLTPDGSGAFDIASVSPAVPVSGGPEGIVYIDSANAGFTVDSILLSEYLTGTVSVYDIDANGDPINASRRPFLTGLVGAEGAVIDPVTGDFLFSTFGGGNRVVLVTGFLPQIPEPTTLLLAGAALSVYGARRR